MPSLAHVLTGPRAASAFLGGPALLRPPGDIHRVCLPHAEGQPGPLGPWLHPAWNRGLWVFDVANPGCLHAGGEPRGGPRESTPQSRPLGARVSLPGLFLACRLRGPLTLELGPQGDIKEQPAPSFEERAGRRPGPERGGRSPAGGLGRRPAAHVMLEESRPSGTQPAPRTGGHQLSPPTLGYRILGKFIFWMEALPWLSLWGPPSCTALVSPLEEQHLPRPSYWASGRRVWRSRGPRAPCPARPPPLGSLGPQLPSLMRALAGSQLPKPRRIAI